MAGPGKFLRVKVFSVYVVNLAHRLVVKQTHDMLLSDNSVVFLKITVTSYRQRHYLNMPPLPTPTPQIHVLTTFSSHNANLTT